MHLTSLDHGPRRMSLCSSAIAVLVVVVAVLTGTATQASARTRPTKPAPAPSAPALSGGSLDAEEAAFCRTINTYRAQNGLGSLRVSTSLTNAAKWDTTDMAQKNYFSHTDSLGRDPFQRMTAFGYNYRTAEGENIAAGNATAAATLNQWKASAAHNQNMLSSAYKVIGIGRSYSAAATYGWYWTTDFGGTTDASSVPCPA